jgi:dTDP-4-amino-4,6-dideoxygalactose transaminase
MDFDPFLANLGMSGLSKYILRNVDIRAVVEKRRQNSVYLVKALSSLSGISAFCPGLPESGCLWVFPVLASGRHNVHHILRARGIPAVTWGGVIHPTFRLEGFPDADFLYQNLVFLPIHQDLGEAEMRIMANVLTEIGLAGNRVHV